MRRVLRWLKRFVVVLVSLFAQTIVMTLLLLHTDCGRAKALDITLSKLQKLFPSGISAKQLNGSVLGEVELLDVTIGAFDKHPMIKAKKVRANLKLLSLFAKTIELEYAIVEDAVVVDPSNPVLLVEDNEPPFAWRVELNNIEVHRASVALTAQNMTFENLEVLAALTVKGSGAGMIARADVKGYWKERGESFHVKTGANIATLVEIQDLDANLGDTTIKGKKITIDDERSTGSLAIHATPGVVKKFAPKFALPEAADIQIDVTRDKESKIDLTAKMGTASLAGAFIGDVQTKQVRGMLTANAIDLSQFVPRLTGVGDAVVAVSAEGIDARATAILRGQLLDLPAGHAVVGLHAKFDGHGFTTPEGVRGVLVAGGEGGLGTAAVGTLGFANKLRKVDLLEARLVTSVTNASKATRGKVPFKGPVAVTGVAKGSIAPLLKIDLDGSLAGSGLSMTKQVGSKEPPVPIGIGDVRGNVDASITESGTFSHLRVTAKGLTFDKNPLGWAEVDARNVNGKASVNVKAYPAAINAVAEIDAVVDYMRADAISIELGKHSVHAGRVNWGGEGGSVSIAERNVVIKNIKSTSGNASVTVDANIDKETGAIELNAKANALPMATVDPTYTGTVTANVDMKRRGISWNGKTTIVANGVTLGPNQPAIEGNVTLTVANRHVTADIGVDTFQIGSARVVFDVDGPPDITDPIGWRKLDRKAIRTALVGITRIDLGALKVKSGGTIDGEIVLSGMDASGTINIKAIQTKFGSVQGTVNFAPVGDDVGISSTLSLAGFGDAQIAAQVAIPMHPFEPAEWKKLGRGALRTLTAQIEDVVIEPEKMAKLGISIPVKAKASAAIVLAAGAGAAKVTVDLKDVIGGKLLKPVDVHVEAATSPQETTASITASASKTELVKLDAKLPTFSFDRWIAEPALVKTAPVEVSLAFPDVDVPTGLALVGRADILTGRLGGAFAVTGTVDKPILGGDVVISNVNVKPRLAGRKLPTLDELHIKPAWDGTTASIDIKGRESDKSTLDIVASVRPDEPKSLASRIVIKKFDVAPVAVFLPGPAVAATGKMSADLTITGLDKIRGTFNLEKGRVPIHPQVGTIRDINLDVKLSDLGLDYKLAAKLGAGTINITGDAPPDLSNVTIRGTVDKFSPIGEVQPLVTTKLAGTIFREAGLVRAEVKLKDTTVTLDMEQGVKLLEDKMPEDVFLGRSTAPPKLPKELRIPRKPWFTITAFVESTPVFVKHEFFELRTRVNANKGITLKIGRNFGMEGSIEIERGDIDIVGRHYSVDPGPDRIRWDGTPDPLLNIRLVHEFPEITLIANVGGRASKREIRMEDRPHKFTEDELFAFFAGGDPGGDSGSTTRDAAQNAAAAFLSAKLGRRAKKILPFKVDVVACDAGSSNSGVSCKLGRWLTDNWFVAFKQRLEPRPDEEPQEVNAQYYFKRNWIFEASGFAERYGGDILWRRRW